MRTEKHRVKPGLSTTSKELYRRVQNGTFDPAVFGKDSFTISAEVDRLKKLSKPALMEETANAEKNIANLKTKINERSKQQPTS